VEGNCFEAACDGRTIDHLPVAGRATAMTSFLVVRKKRGTPYSVARMR